MRDILFSVLITLLITLIYLYAKVTDFQIDKLDKRITNLEVQIHVAEEKLKDKHK